MVDIGFEMTPSMAERRATIHQRAQDGTLTPQPDLVFPQPPPMDMGGHGIYASMGEYMKFIRTILYDGAAPDGTQTLQPATVQKIASNGLGQLRSGGWITSIPSLSNAGEFSCPSRTAPPTPDTSTSKPRFTATFTKAIERRQADHSRWGWRRAGAGHKQRA